MWVFFSLSEIEVREVKQHPLLYNSFPINHDFVRYGIFERAGVVRIVNCGVLSPEYRSGTQLFGLKKEERPSRLL